MDISVLNWLRHLNLHPSGKWFCNIPKQVQSLGTGLSKELVNAGYSFMGMIYQMAGLPNWRNCNTVRALNLRCPESLSFFHITMFPFLPLIPCSGVAQLNTISPLTCPLQKFLGCSIRRLWKS